MTEKYINELLVMDGGTPFNYEEKKDVMFTKNQYAIVETFVTNDSWCIYNGEDGIYRFSAIATDIYKVRIFNPDNIEETESNIKILLDLVRGLPIKPDYIAICDDYIDLMWTSNGCQVVKSHLDYFKISFEFANYIDTLDFSDLEINTGSFDDSLVQVENPNDRHIMGENSTFSNCFGTLSTTEYEIYDWREIKNEDLGQYGIERIAKGNLEQAKKNMEIIVELLQGLQIEIDRICIFENDNDEKHIEAVLSEDGYQIQIADKDLNSPF